MRKTLLKLMLRFVFCLVTSYATVFSLSAQSEKEILQGPFSIQQCVEIALKNSPEIAIVKGEVRKSALDVGDAKAGFLPEINLSGGYYLNETYNSMKWNDDHYDLSFSASVEPFSGGRNYLYVKKSNANLASAREGYRLTKQDLVMKVIEKYYNLLKTSKILELRETILQQKQNQLDVSKAQFELGMVPRADTLKARATLESARVNLHETRGELQIARAELNEVMGLDLDFPLDIEDVKLEDRSIPDFDSILFMAYENRPDLKKQKFSMTADKYNLTGAWIDRMPVLSLIGDYNVYTEEFAFEGLPVNEANWEENSDWSVGLTLSFPIFDGGVKSRAITRANIDLNNTRLRYENLKRQAKLEVKSAHINLENASKKIELTERQVVSAEESYEVAQGRYKNGLAPITEVIDAEVALTEGQINFISSKYDFLEAEALLEKAIGILYSKEELE